MSKKAAARSRRLLWEALDHHPDLAKAFLGESVNEAARTRSRIRRLLRERREVRSRE